MAHPVLVSPIVLVVPNVWLFPMFPHCSSSFSCSSPCSHAPPVPPHVPVAPPVPPNVLVAPPHILLVAPPVPFPCFCCFSCSSQCPGCSQVSPYIPVTLHLGCFHYGGKMEQTVSQHKVICLASDNEDNAEDFKFVPILHL